MNAYFYRLRSLEELVVSGNELEVSFIILILWLVRYGTGKRLGLTRVKTFSFTYLLYSSIPLLCPMVCQFLECSLW